MNTITHNDFRQNLETYLEKVYHNNIPIMISNNKENVVLLSANEYNSLVETSYLLSNKANIEHLNTSVQQHKTGDIVVKELIEYE